MKVVTVTPAGRKIYLEILARYLLNNRQYISEHHFWLNTVVKEDIAYIEMLAAKYPDFFKINRKAFLDKAADRIWQYYKDYVDDNTIYIKLDDDICYFEEDAIKNLIACRINNPDPLFIFGTILNNAVCSYFFQKKGIIPLSWGRVGYNAIDDSGWLDAEFAERLHGEFIKDIKTGNLDKWKMDDVTMNGFGRYSIGVICWSGRDLKGVPELNSSFDEKIDERTGTWRFTHGDESFLSQDLPQRLNRPNVICGNALFGHFAFYIQRDYLEFCTALLEEYKAIAFDDHSISGKLHREILGRIRKLTGQFIINVKGRVNQLRRNAKEFLEKSYPGIYAMIRKVKK